MDWEVISRKVIQKRDGHTNCPDHKQSLKISTKSRDAYQLHAHRTFEENPCCKLELTLISLGYQKPRSLHLFEQEHNEAAARST